MFLDAKYCTYIIYQHILAKSRIYEKKYGLTGIWTQASGVKVDCPCHYTTMELGKCFYIDEAYFSVLPERTN